MIKDGHVGEHTQLSAPYFVRSMDDHYSVTLDDGREVKIISARVVRRPATEAKDMPWRRRVRAQTAVGTVIFDMTMRYCKRHKWDEEMLFLPVGKRCHVDRRAVPDLPGPPPPSQPQPQPKPSLGGVS